MRSRWTLVDLVIRTTTRLGILLFVSGAALAADQPKRGGTLRAS